MNPKALIPLVVGLGIAGVAAKLGLDFVKKANGNQVQTVSLWAPAQDIPRGVAINETMLKPMPFPVNVAPKNALSDVEKIVGRVPHTGAPAGVPILDSMLLPPGVSPGVRVPPGFRAVAVKIDEASGVDNHLEPGCHVDVVGVFTARRNNKAETVAKTLLENVEVAAVGQRLSPEAPTPGAEDGKRSQRERPPRAVTLLVQPDQVPILHLAEQKGKIKLSMRGQSDQQIAAHAAQYDTNRLLGDEEDKPAEPQNDWGEQVGSFIGALWPKTDVPAAPQPEPTIVAPTPDIPPQPEWVMAIYNGDDRRVLGWTDMNSFQPIELSSEGPNIFQEEPRLPPMVPQPTPPAGTRGDAGQSSGDSVSVSDVGDAQDEESQSQSEPQELFE